MTTAMTTIATTAPALSPEPHHEMSVKQVTKPVVELPGLDDKIPSECASVDNKDGKTMLESFWIITIITGVTFISVSGTGILTTALPRISTDINLDRDLIFWPASVYALSAGCTLLALGSVADVIGSKRMWLIGSGVSCPLILACGLARTGDQFIVFRALLGLFVAMCLSTSMSLVTSSFPPGPKRNIAFAATGMGQPLGYALGLILGGVLSSTIGWRWGFYITAIVDAVLFVASIFVLPSDADSKKLSKATWHRLAYDIDWVGVAILATSLGLLSYVLAMVTLSYKNISQPQNIVLLAISILLLPAFSLWVRRQVKREKAALIPNALWQNLPFLFICMAMFFTWAAFNAFQYISTLFFQDVQNISALQASIRFLPMAVVGVLTNIIAAYLVAKVNVNMLLGIAAVITAVSPILMAIASPEWTYWTAAFVAITLSPINGDVLWTASSLVICRAFPADSQALAGGVFNTISQLGNSIGLAVTAAIAASVSTHDHNVVSALSADGSSATDANTPLLLQGYRAAYWTIFGGMVVVCLASFLGLRHVGKVGVKED
ncbi:major facilitator superfamily domain, general substrate transporter [Lipomyces tetrasporus]|uniref:Major facilitator superfamily domain, general substrate transporter n=1 Tax=Lipomyces tetrasporus TaxID=54092 RepID=A0AAD7QRI5_9ASCO|nr:major facilitator superfamily domain, general substrate transporter [Lipomyces tetrasporus]KAJ8100153.1 major facilitator superfamily domain, general substrate transporter [Lipomyces tetrasporus]